MVQSRPVSHSHPFTRLSPARTIHRVPSPHMSTWWVTDVLKYGGYIYLFSWIFWVLLSICLHELAHGWAAIRQGDDTPIALGHMNLNPLVHMGQMSLLMFAIIGIAWGAMPVNPSRFRDGRFGDAKVAAAGPAMNLLLALMTLTGLGMLAGMTAGKDAATSTFVVNFGTFLWVGGRLNLALMILNLLPIPPLDGSTIVRSLVPATEQFYLREGIDRIGLVMLIAVFWFGGRYLWFAAETAAMLWRDFVVGALA